MSDSPPPIFQPEGQKPAQISLLLLVDLFDRGRASLRTIAGSLPAGGSMQYFAFFAPGVFMAFDFFWLQHAVIGFIGSLFLPIILLVVLAGAMGGNGPNIAEALFDTLGTVLVLLLELGLRLGHTLILAFIYLTSAVLRMALSWARNRPIKLKTGPDPENGGGADTSTSGKGH
jgi:hypothetical protein